MNIVVVGGGAVGSVVATDLARAGEDVTLLVPAQALPSSGTLKTTVQEAEHEARWAIIPVISAITEKPDLVILCVKTPDLETASAALVGTIGDVPVVMLHAAPQGDAIVNRVLGRVCQSGVFLGSAESMQLGQTQVMHPQLALSANPADVTDMLPIFAQALPTTRIADLAALRWALLLANLPQAIAAITNQALPAIAEDRTTMAIATTLLNEATRVFAKAAIIPANVPDLDMAKLRRLHSMPGIFAARVVRQETALFLGRGMLISPLLQSLRRRHSTEIDALHGEIVRLGQQHGVPTPVMARLVEFIHGIEQSGNFLAFEKIKQALRV